MVNKIISKIFTIVIILVISIVAIILVIKPKNILLNENDIVHIDNKTLTITNIKTKSTEKYTLNKNDEISIMKNDIEIYKCKNLNKQDLMFNDDNLKLIIK